MNETFREILNNKDGQVRFVELQPRPNILPGKVIRVPLAKELLPEGKKLKDYQKARIETEYLARWIKDAGLKKLSADSFHGAKRQVYSAVARKICASAKVDLRRRHVRRGRGAA